MCVEILMSTYNGEQYLSEQLESIMSQTVNTHLTVRDDGSTDSTEKILQSYKNVQFYKGSNVGSTESFLRLIEIAPENQYYAFSDQDDVWDSDKLECAIRMLKEHDSIPAAYSSNTRLVNNKLEFIRNEDKKPKLNLGSAIVKNYATGCTVVFNKLLMEELKKYHPHDISFHDWWVNILCLSIGGISIFDKQPHICYRQHKNNVVSGNDTMIKKWQSRLKKFTRPYHRDQMAKQILQNYSGKISEENKKILMDVAIGKYDKYQKTGKVIDDFLYRICVLTGKN